MVRSTSERDGRLVATALSGRRDAYLALFERHHHQVIRLAAGFGDLDGMERTTLAEEVFARAFAELPSLKEPARFESWLLVLSRQTARARVERRRGLQTFVGAPERPIELAPDPGSSAALAEAKALLGQAPGAPSTLAQQFYRDGAVPLNELARRSGTPISVAEAQVESLRARLKLRLASSLLAGRSPEARRGDAPEGIAHLRRDTWERTLRGERFDGELALGSHLAVPCELCEQRLMEIPGVDGLDGDADRALVALGLKPAITPSDASFERVMRRVRLDSRVAGRGDLALLSLRPGNALPLVLAGLLAFAGLGALALQRTPSNRPPVISARPGRTSPDVKLTFSVVPALAGREVAVLGKPGAALDERQELYLHYQLARPAFVSLVQVRPDGVAEVLAQPGRMNSGRHDLSVNDARVRVSLRGARGLNRFAVLATDAPLSEDEQRSALEILARGEAQPGLDAGMAGDWFEIAVVP